VHVAIILLIFNHYWRTLMHIKLDKKALQEALTLSRGAVDTANPVSVTYESVRFSAAPEGLWVDATDGAVWSSVKVDADWTGGISPILIKASQFTDIVSGLDDGELEIAANGQQAALKQGRYKANFGVADGMEFPARPMLGDSKLVSIDAAKFVEMIRAVEGSADTRADRPYLNGVHFEVRGDDLEAVAADGSRLAHSELLGGFTGQTLVGTAGTRLARQWASLAVMRPVDKSIRFGFHEGWGFMLGEDAIIAGLLPDQRFPDWRAAAMFPKPGDKSRVIRLSRKLMAKAVKRVIAIGSKLKGEMALDVEMRADGAVWLSAMASGKSAEERLDGHVVDRCGEGAFTRRVGGAMLLQAIGNLSPDGDKINLTAPAHDQKPISVSNSWEDPDGVMTEHYLMPRS
jgi:DNA polymerase III sliding clamp (beta) subunit (PCNA family)